jgi:hypothetical protein
LSFYSAKSVSLAGRFGSVFDLTGGEILRPIAIGGHSMGLKLFLRSGFIMHAQKKTFLTGYFSSVAFDTTNQRGRALIVDTWSSGGARTNLADGMGAPMSSLCGYLGLTFMAPAK